MQWQVRHVGDCQRPGVGDHLVALGLVDFLQHRVGERVELGVAVVGVVPAAHLLGRIVGLVEEGEDVVRVERRHAPAQQVETRILLLDLGEMQCLRARLQVNLDTDLRQHAGDGLADLLVVVVAVVGAVERDAEAVGIAGLGHQLLGRRDVVLLALVERRCMAVYAGRGDEAGGRGEVAHHLGLDRVDVDRLVHGLAHALVGERVLALDVGVFQLGRAHVEAEEDRAHLRGLLGLEAGSLLDAGDVLQRRVEHEVDLARDQRGDTGRWLLDRRVDQLVGIVREVLGAPVGRVLHHHGAHVGVALLHHVGAGAHGVAHGVGLFLFLEVLRLGDVVLLRPCP